MGTEPTSCSSHPLCSTHQKKNVPASTSACGTEGVTSERGCWLHFCLLRAGSWCTAERKAGSHVRRSQGMLGRCIGMVPRAWQSP